MAKFQFPLERVAAFRRTQATMERARLERMQSTLEDLRRSRADLGRERQRSAAALARPGAISASWSAQNVDAYAQYTEEEIQRIRAQEARQQLEIEAQRKRVVEAERKCELLDQLREKRHETWRQNEAKQLEELAADAHLAAWNKRQ